MSLHRIMWLELKKVSNLGLLVFRSDKACTQLSVFPVFHASKGYLVGHLLGCPQTIFLTFPSPDVRVVVTVQHTSFQGAKVHR